MNQRLGWGEQHLIRHLAEFLFKRQHNEYKERLHHIFRGILIVYDGETVQLIRPTLTPSHIFSFLYGYLSGLSQVIQLLSYVWLKAADFYYDLELKKKKKT